MFKQKFNNLNQISLSPFLKDRYNGNNQPNRNNEVIRRASNEPPELPSLRH